MIEKEKLGERTERDKERRRARMGILIQYLIATMAAATVVILITRFAIHRNTTTTATMTVNDC